MKCHEDFSDKQSELISLRSCAHLLCPDCFSGLVTEECSWKKIIDCPECGKIIHEDEIREVMGSDKWEELIEQLEKEMHDADEHKVK